MVDTVLHGDCLEIMKSIDDSSIDIVLCDLPYGVTARNDWDNIIDIDKIWHQYRRIIKDNGAIILTGQGAFSAKMICAAIDLYKYSLIWKKNKVRGFLNAKRQPLRTHEDIMIFYKKQPVYNPQKTTGHSPVHAYYKAKSDGTNYNTTKPWSGGGSTERYPTSIVEIPVVNNDSPERVHPCQKPVALGEYLIKTFSNPSALVLDNACGSGSFLVAAKNCGRHYLGIEINAEMVEIATKRLNAV